MSKDEEEDNILKVNKRALKPTDVVLDPEVCIPVHEYGSTRLFECGKKRACMHTVDYVLGCSKTE